MVKTKQFNAIISSVDPNSATVGVKTQQFISIGVDRLLNSQSVLMKTQ